MRLLLDANVWSYVGDAKAGDGLALTLRDAGYRLVLAPSVLLEVAQTPNVDARDRILHAMTRARGDRLRTEADLESDEIIAEVRRCHPDWLRRPAVTWRALEYRRYWTSGIWRSLPRHPVAHQAHFDLNNAPIKEHISGVQAFNRTATRAGQPLRTRHFLDWTASVPDDAPSPLPGWDGQPVDEWRVELAIHMQHALHELPARWSPSTDADWVGAQVDLRRMYADHIAVTRFFLEEVELTNVPRLWLHIYAVSKAQLYFKLSDGNSLDQQHAAYLLECERFLTADRRFRDCLEAIREVAPFEFAEVRLVSGDSSIPVLDRVRDALT